MRNPIAPRLLALLALFVACGDDGAEMPEEAPSILAIRYVAPAIAGTVLHVTVSDPALLQASATLRIAVPPDEAEARLVERAREGNVVEFAMTPAAIDLFGAGQVQASATLDQAEEGFAFSLQTATELLPALSALPSGGVRLHDAIVIEGEGFLSEGEGRSELAIVGRFSSELGMARDVDVRLPLQLIGQDRLSATADLPYAISAGAPGSFEGEARVLTQRGAEGAEMASQALPLDLEFLPPIVFEVTPEIASLEEIIQVRGGGFAGEDDDCVTILRLSGTLSPEGGSPITVSGVELIFNFVSGQLLAGPLSAEAMGDRLIAAQLGIARGVFEGEVTPVIAGPIAVEIVGDSAPVRVELGPTQQILWVRFLADFYTSLARFGLSASAGVIEQRVAERIEAIYARWNIDVRLEEPTDFSPQGVSLVEVGGPDPNGRGLFGYDNSPGKDVGNVRLYDRIGGENAETQADGYPGFGGVFVESFFGFSTHPPSGEPLNPDPLFDEIFDPVRAQEATLSEVRGEGERAALVARAIAALAAVIGETIAHEVGHSLGLAEPFGLATIFHNAGDSPGCLMDTGSARPFGERAAQAGYASTQLCGDSLEYLDGILRD